MSYVRPSQAADRIEGKGPMSGYYDIHTGEPVTDDELETRFVDMLDECYDEFRMGEISFRPSDILKSCDPIAFRVYLADYVSGEIDETLTEDAELAATLRGED